MEIILNKENYQNFERWTDFLVGRKELIIKNEGDIDWMGILDKLKIIIDQAIEKNVEVAIFDIPFCFLLGYKMYIKFSDKEFTRDEKCNGCKFSGVCRGIEKKYAEKFGTSNIKPVGAESFITDLEKCMLTILRAKNNISTKEVLELAKQFAICAGCGDGNHVLSTGDKLIRKGIIKKEFEEGVYYWSLICYEK